MVTGSAGFIGFHLTSKLLELGHEVMGIDNINDYYDVSLKKLRLEILRKINSTHFNFIEGDISNQEFVKRIFAENKFDAVIHLAAQAGVRLSILDYGRYTKSNLVGFENIASQVKINNISNFLYASSSSVYGDFAKVPLSEDELLLKPNSYYGATKLSNEIVAGTLFRGTKINARGLRFFSVYGPFGRPDMAYFKLMRSIILGSEFSLFGDGTLKRDFTYIDDVIKMVVELLLKMEKSNSAICDVVNIGGGSPKSMNELIDLVEKVASKKALIRFEKAFKDDSKITWADNSYLQELIGLTPETTLLQGIEQTYTWISSAESISNIKNWT